MTPRTRPGNRDADFKVYYSKQVPQQLHFPHKRKTVHRPSSPARVDSGKRQMVFLPEKMKLRPADTVGDSDEETEDDDLEAGSPTTDEPDEHGHPSRDQARKGTKRSKDAGHEAVSDEEQPPRLTSKRRRTAATVRTERTLRRQSTMTQLVDGRRPLSNAEEPDFKPVKRGSRLSWGGKGRSKSKDTQQRTLTQMMPAMRPLGIMSDEDNEDALSDLEAQESDSQAYDLAVAQRLAVQGYQEDADPDVNIEHQPKDAHQPITGPEDDEAELPFVVVQSVEDATNDAGEESYRPTQYIDGPSSRPRRTAQRSINTELASRSLSIASTPMARRAQKPRFGLLNTPEKRRTREIPSSQSPADSPLSTQVSPQKSYRSPLHESSGNSVRASETFSTRKRVAFKEPSAPRTPRKFDSTIQDSEDEDDGIEEDFPAPTTLGELHTNTKLVRNTSGEQAPDISEPSNAHHGDPTPLPVSTPHSKSHDEDLDGPVLTNIKSPLPDSTECLRSLPPPSETDHQETFRSTPMVIQNYPSDEELDKGPTPPHQSSRHILEADHSDVQHIADLDSKPIQVPRSPSAQHETQQSHSNKADQQLRSEWFSYSQYVNTQPPTSLSMFVVYNPSSYGATQLLQHNSAPQPHSIAHPPSQATTLDEVTQRTPRKSRTQQLTSVNSTPRKIARSQPVMSPGQPPPLIIPSSFPSPTKAAMQEWSSPVYEDVSRSSQFGMSLEDFSIPLPPPVEDDWGYDE